VATPKIKTRITEQDVFEVVGLQIAAILELESLGQQQMAKAEGDDPAGLKLRVFYESSNPIADWLMQPQQGQPFDTSPIVHVHFDRDTFPKSKGAPHGRTHADGVWNIDCYGYGITQAFGASEQKTGAQQAMIERNRAARLVRNILMAGHYQCLALPSIVGSSWFASRQAGDLSDDELPSQHVKPIRLQFEVGYLERLTPQIQPVELQVIGVTIKRDGSGQLITYAEVDVATPAQP
jgi:hypothetical protein